jgi:hypothetical protein
LSKELIISFTSLGAFFASSERTINHLGDIMIKLLLLISLSLLISCAQQGGSSEPAGPTERELSLQAFEVVLEGSTEMGHTLVKSSTEKGNFAVFKNDTTGVYTAYNLDKFDRNTMTTWGAFKANTVESDIIRHLDKITEYIEDGYWESEYDTVTEYYYYEEWSDYCECYETYTETYTYEVYVGENWVDTSYWYTYYSGGGFRFDNSSAASKDLEMLAALKEEVALKLVTHELETRFALSADRSGELANLLQKYRKLESNRALTATEKDYFAMNSLGVSLNDAERALREKAQGDNTAYQDLLNEAAEVNRTTPEQVAKFLEEYIIQ